MGFIPASSTPAHQSVFLFASKFVSQLKLVAHPWNGALSCIKLNELVEEAVRVTAKLVYRLIDTNYLNGDNISSSLNRKGLTRMASASPNASAQTLRRILVDLELGGRATFDKDERRLVLQILLELVEKMAKLEEDVRQARPMARGRTES